MIDFGSLGISKRSKGTPNVQDTGISHSPSSDVFFSSKELGIKWIEDLASYSSLHGVGWYHYASSKVFKAIIMVASCLIVLMLPIFILLQSLEFSSNTKVTNSAEWSTADSMTYPNITVCHPKYFNSDLLRAYGIDNDLAGYMTFAVNPNAQRYLKFMEDEDNSTQTVTTRLHQQSQQLAAILNSKNLNILDLYHKVAVRCKDFIIYCEMKAEIYSNTNINGSPGQKTCCDILFDPKPTFGFSGTCFTTNVEIRETFPSIFHSLKIWTYVDSQNAPSFGIPWKGTDAAERNGIVWAVTYNNSPAVIMSHRPNKLSSGTHASIGLTKSEIDRIDVPGGCLKTNQTFTDLTGMVNTKANCQGFANHFQFGKCSLAVFYGYKTWKSIPPCTPEDMVNQSTPTATTETGGLLESCLDDCNSIRYHFSQSLTNLDLQTVKDFVNSKSMRNEEGQMIYQSPEDMNSLTFYFETFDFSRTEMKMDTFYDFLAKIGGTMSLIIGASIITVLEIAYFLLYFGTVIVVDCFNLFSYFWKTRGEVANTIHAT